MMLQPDPIAKEMLATFKIHTPNQDAEMKSYIAYFKWADEHLRPIGRNQLQFATPGRAQPVALGPAGDPGQHGSTAQGAPIRPSPMLAAGAGLV